jgi:hypothetical protein
MVPTPFFVMWRVVPACSTVPQRNLVPLVRPTRLPLARGFAHRTKAKHKRRQWLPACHGPWAAGVWGYPVTI